MSVGDEVHAHANSILTQAKNQTDLKAAIELVVSDFNSRLGQVKAALDDCIMNADPVKLNNLSDLLNALTETAMTDETEVSAAILANTDPEPEPAELPTTEHQPAPAQTPIDELPTHSASPDGAPPEPFDTAAPHHTPPPPAPELAPEPPAAPAPAPAAAPAAPPAAPAAAPTPAQGAVGTQQEPNPGS